MNEIAEKMDAVATVQPPKAVTMSDVDSAMARAEVEAQYIVAYKSPRDMDQVRIKCLKACRRPAFARTGMYVKTVDTRNGTTVEGLSIRAAEEVFRNMGNLTSRSSIIFEDDQVRKIRISVTDLESNATYHKDVTLNKIVERKFPPQGRVVIGTRTKSDGNTIYLVAASEDELQNKEAAMASKIIRNAVLRFLPADIHEEMVEAIKETNEGSACADPDAERKRVVDAFAKLGIEPKQLSLFLGHPLEQITPKEIANLRGIWQSIKDGDTSWKEIMASLSDEKPATKKTIKDKLKTVAAEPEPAAATTIEDDVP